MEPMNAYVNVHQHGKMLYYFIDLLRLPKQ